MLTEDAVQRIAEALLKKAATSDLEWEEKDGKHLVRLPVAVVALSQKDDSPQPDIVFEVDTLQGKQLGVVEVKSGEKWYAPFSELIGFAKDYNSDWSRTLREMVRLLEEGESSDTPAQSPPPSPPPLPVRPPQEAVEAFFKKIAGVWELEFETPQGSIGRETAEIDVAGNYFVRQTPNTRTIFPKFRLLLVSCSDDLASVGVG